MRKVKTEAMTNEWASDGTYMTFRRIVQEYGGDKDALEAGAKYCKKAAQLGDPWVKFDKMGEVWKFLYKTEHIRERFERAWKMHEENSQNYGKKDPEKSAPESGPPASPAA
eukprot:9119087-Alexandrium_andersonii.AAC.1